jgi:hypothetical protein
MARMAWLRKTLGQEARANVLIEEMRSNLEWLAANNVPPAVQAHARALIAGATGDEMETIAHAKRFVDLGYHPDHMLYDPLFAKLRNHPDGLAFLEQFEEQQAAKLAKLKETAEPILFDPPETVDGFL